jgi:hypothetical protein
MGEMQVALAETVGRVLDPKTPVVWLDPTLPEALWEALPEALERAGFRVGVLEAAGGIGSADGFLHRLGELRGEQAEAGYSAEAVREALNGLREMGGRGWVLLWRNPEPVRQENESRFEEIVDVLESLHEEGSGTAPKLVVAD